MGLHGPAQSDAVAIADKRTTSCISDTGIPATINFVTTDSTLEYFL